MHRRQGLARRCGSATLDGLGAFLQTAGASTDSLGATLGHTLGMTLLGRTWSACPASVGRALATPTLLGRELLGRLGRLRGGSRLGSGLLGSCLLRLGRLTGLRVLARRCVRLGVLGLLVVCVVCHVYPFRSLSSAFFQFWVGRSAGLAVTPRSRATVSARASSRRARLTLAVSSSSPVAFAKRLPNRSLRKVVICSASSSGSISLISLAFIARLSPRAKQTWI